jgi:hypothetical protein
MRPASDGWRRIGRLEEAQRNTRAAKQLCKSGANGPLLRMSALRQKRTFDAAMGTLGWGPLGTDSFLQRRRQLRRARPGPMAKSVATTSNGAPDPITSRRGLRIAPHSRCDRDRATCRPRPYSPECRRRPAKRANCSPRSACVTLGSGHLSAEGATVDFADRTLWKYAFLTELGLSATRACRNMAPVPRSGREATISIGLKAELEFGWAESQRIS